MGQYTKTRSQQGSAARAPVLAAEAARLEALGFPPAAWTRNGRSFKTEWPTQAGKAGELHVQMLGEQVVHLDLSPERLGMQETAAQIAEMEGARADSNATAKPKPDGSAADAGAGDGDQGQGTEAPPREPTKLAYALAYAWRGFRVFPLHNIEADHECSCGRLSCASAGKHPIFSGWQTDATIDEAQIRQWWIEHPDANIGIACGRESNLTVLDVDGEVGRSTLRDLELENGELPETPIVLTGSGGAHYYFRYEPDVGNAVRFAEGLDVRTEGGLVVGVGSENARGPYRWEASASLRDLEPSTLPAWLVEKIKAAATTTSGNFSVPDLSTMTEGNGRNDTLYKLGRALRARQLPPAAIEQALVATNGKMAQPLDNRELATIVHGVLSQADRPSFQVPATSGDEAPWEAPVSLDVPILPSLPPDLLPDWCKEMAVGVSRATETPFELAATIGLGVLAACNQGDRVEVQAGYSEPLALWICTALDSGNRKTNVLVPMTSPLTQWDSEQAGKMAVEIERAKSRRETMMARIEAMRREAAKASSGDFEQQETAIAELEQSLPVIPKSPQLWAQDVTPEALGSIMADNGGRMVIISDEGGIFDILAGRYSGGIPNLDLFLKAHSGSPARVNRQGRPAEVITRPLLSMVLSPQPEVLRQLADRGRSIEHAAKRTFRGRGLLARFLYCLPPSPLGYRTGATRSVPRGVEETYNKRVRELLDSHAKSAEPVILTLSAGARSEWREFGQVVEAAMRDGGAFEHLRDWAGKLPGAAVRIAGNLHRAQDWQGTEINLETMRRALGFASALSQHALAAFDLMGCDPVIETARRIWRWIERERLCVFTARDVFQALRGAFPRVADLEPGFEVLIERFYLRERPKAPGVVGRPSRAFDVNPALTEQWKPPKPADANGAGAWTGAN
jgi:Protein of unknown function (DUF3987)/Bifunctional DNA primase/polymerase, N-terminal/Primase C terminal 1 (PriCT-1)